MSDLKNKEATKKKLLDAVAEIFRSEGYHGLGVNKVARIAGIDKKLIYRYFGGLNGLVEAYVTETDYWIVFADHLIKMLEEADQHSVPSIVSSAFTDQFDYFFSNTGMQQLILWELSGNSNLMKSIHRARELTAQKFLNIANPYLKNNEINFRAIAALLAGGIYYMILHTTHNGHIFADIDLNTTSGRSEIKKAIVSTVHSSFKET